MSTRYLVCLVALRRCGKLGQVSRAQPDSAPPSAQELWIGSATSRPGGIRVTSRKARIGIESEGGRMTRIFTARRSDFYLP